MAEIKKLWVVWDANISAEDFFNDPTIEGDDERQIQEFMGEHTMNNILWQIEAMGARKFEKGNAKFYINEADAKKDAKARWEKLRKSLKTAATLPEKVASRFQQG